jgi:hypothetical protein
LQGIEIRSPSACWIALSPTNPAFKLLEARIRQIIDEGIPEREFNRAKNWLMKFPTQNTPVTGKMKFELGLGHLFKEVDNSQYFKNYREITPILQSNINLHPDEFKEPVITINKGLNTLYAFSRGA